jgi:hypothetical protein
MPAGTLTLKQAFQNINGTLGSTPITEGKLRGAQIEFSAGGQKYTGTVDGNTIKGQGWTATRK